MSPSVSSLSAFSLGCSISKALGAQQGSHLLPPPYVTRTLRAAGTSATREQGSHFGPRPREENSRHQEATATPQR